MRSARGDVRDTLKNGLQQVSLSGPKSANREHALQQMETAGWLQAGGQSPIGDIR